MCRVENAPFQEIYKWPTRMKMNESTYFLSFAVSPFSICAQITKIWIICYMSFLMRNKVVNIIPLQCHPAEYECSHRAICLLPSLLSAVEAGLRPGEVDVLGAGPLGWEKREGERGEWNTNLAVEIERALMERKRNITGGDKRILYYINWYYSTIKDCFQPNEITQLKLTAMWPL